MQMKILEKKLLSYTENESNFSTLDSVKSEKISELRKNFLQNLNKNIEQEMQLSNNHISGSEVVNEYNSSLLFALNLLGVLTKFLV
jgi:hypothetical protein